MLSFVLVGFSLPPPGNFSSSSILFCFVINPAATVIGTDRLVEAAVACSSLVSFSSCLRAKKLFSSILNLHLSSFSNESVDLMDEVDEDREVVLVTTNSDGD